jgi:beta-fructofuranosidase
VLLYRSNDLINWDYLHPLHVGDKDQTEPIWTERMWECPDLFRLGDKHILIISTAPDWRAALYFVGSYTDHKFRPERLQFLDYGVKQFFAPQTFLDERGRRLMFGWLWEGRTVTAQRAAGWSGVMSLPRLLSPREDGLIGIEPAPELNKLRGQQFQLSNVMLTPNSSNLLAGITGDCLEIIAEFEQNPATPAQAFGLKLRCSPDGEEQTLIVYDRKAKRLDLLRDRSSLGPEADRDARGGPFDLQSGETLRLHIFLDRSVVEVFANGWVCLTARIYPTRTDSLGLAPYIEGGQVVLKSIDIWEVKSIWG